MRPVGTPDELERRRLRAVTLMTQGHPPVKVARLIAQCFCVHYHVDHVGRLLHSLGWSPQKPSRRAIERDEGGIRQWIKQTWPALKKSWPAERLAIFPR
jgi:transposase